MVKKIMDFEEYAERFTLISMMQFGHRPSIEEIMLGYIDYLADMAEEAKQYEETQKFLSSKFKHRAGQFDDLKKTTANASHNGARKADEEKDEASPYLQLLAENKKLRKENEELKEKLTIYEKALRASDERKR